MSSTVKYGIIGGLLLSILGIINIMMQPTELEFSAGQYAKGFIFPILNTIIVFIVLYLSTAEKRKNELGGYMRFGQGFGHSYKTSLVIIGAAMVVLAAYCYVIDPNWNPIEADALIEFTEEQAGMELPEVSKNMMRMQINYATELLVFGSALWRAIGFAILSLIVGAVMIKANPNEVNL